MKINSVILMLLALNVFIPAALGLSFSLEPQPELGQLRDFKGSELCQVAENSKHYLQSQGQDTFAVHPGKQINDQITLKRVEHTLAFICQTYREDVRAKRQSRLHDKAFLKQHFEFVRWRPDKETAAKIAGKSTNESKARMLNNIPDEEIFLTKYYTKLLDGSPVKTEHYDQALYALPKDEQGLSLAQAEQQKEHLTRFRFTRQQIIAGALVNDKLAKPLVWLTEEALHDVLLQGTGVLKVDGKIRYFNVHRNNGITYDYTIGKREQPRYWYFVETPEIMGYGQDQSSKIAIKPQVTFAGNIADLGVGKLIMVSYRDNKGQVSRLGILADQGGAFDNNLFQLDLLVDSYRGWSDYHSHNGHLPDYARAWILLLK
ncbi:MltA domain-containing protein [Thalassomonas actiniarum]|uniref:MltA domain-containing protein n=1 Tax=Thalassomonas actiniarum TaxID=485447 RepID=A0AAF0C3F7_9GAMM|nr:MltA domain-containing protein [Thalassomonas actiniarum]WDD98903.1 MltA domain-containing protein [Thalassomonas actiniarum]